MKTPYSHDVAFIAKLRSIEQQISQNQLQEAAAQLNLLVKKAPQDPRVYLLGSRLAEAARNPDAMLHAARKAHQLVPLWPVATVHLAGVLASRGDADEAITMAALAVQQLPGDVGTLVKCGSVAVNLKRFSLALQWLRDAEHISPDDLSIKYKIGLTLIYGGDPEGAVSVFTDLLGQMPNNRQLLSARMDACLAANQNEQAILDGEALIALDPDNEVIKFYLAVARGETPQTQPAAVVSNLYDELASRFDRRLVGQLHYTLPREVAELILQWHPDRRGDVLDLGCGTGLLGACLGPIEGVLVGVDLSGEMIQQAIRHQVYDKFHQVNLLDALQATPENLYQVIAALDVMIYVGKLDSVLSNAFRILLPGGRLVFSYEVGTDGEPDYVLQSTQRYTHQTEYVKSLLALAGFEETVLNEKVLRMEDGKEVMGCLVIARKPQQVNEKIARRLPKNAKPVRPPQ